MSDSPKYTFDPDDAPFWLQETMGAHDDSSLLAGVNEDDCAVYQVETEGRCLVLTTDYVNASPIAMQLDLGTLFDLGRILVAANFADLLSSGAIPRLFLSSITMEREATREDFRLLMQGVISECTKWSVPLVGGDSKIGRSRALCGTAVGWVDHPSGLCLKRSAIPGDEIWATGHLGSTAAALHSLTSRSNVGDLELVDWCKERILVPRLPLELATKAFEENLLHAGTDISDGLAVDSLSIARCSEVGLRLNAKEIPVESEARQIADLLGVPHWVFPFCLGGDFQILYTAPPSNSGRLERLGFIHVGEVTEGSGLSLMVEGREHTVGGIGHRDAKGLTFAEELRLHVEHFLSLVGGSHANG